MSRYFMMHTQALKQMEQQNRVLQDNRKSKCPGRPALPPEFSVKPAPPPPSKHPPRDQTDYMYRTASRSFGEQFERPDNREFKYVADQRTMHEGKNTSFTKKNGLEQGGLLPIYPHAGCARVRWPSFMSSVLY
jgi:hypothetical protein